MYFGLVRCLLPRGRDPDFREQEVVSDCYWTVCSGPGRGRALHSCAVVSERDCSEPYPGRDRVVGLSGSIYSVKA